MKSSRTRLRIFSTLGAAALAVAFALASTTSDAQVKQGKSRLALTKHLMGGLVKVHCAEVKKLIDAGPAADKEWQQLQVHAAVLNEASYMLMEDGRCPDEVWAGAAGKALREASAAVYKAAGEKSLEEAKKSFGALTGACGTCHKAHKK